MAFSEADIGDQTGTTVLITGANSGLGLRTATVLASKGARVLLGCRSPERGRDAVRQVAAGATGPPPELLEVDLADQSSIRAAAERATDLCAGGIDVLVNNAGVMATPKARTVDGFEQQLGTNHLGHAALTWLLLPALRTAGTAERPARVVTVSSLAATRGRIDVDDPHFERRRYNPVSAYGQAKLANQVFAIELNRRLQTAGEPVISIAAHPGLTATNLASNMAHAYRSPVVAKLVGAGAWFSDTVLAQDDRQGTLPQLYAATAESLSGGEYIGPDGFQQTRGAPTLVRPLRPARDPQTGRRLWDLTRQQTGIDPGLP